MATPLWIVGGVAIACFLILTHWATRRNTNAGDAFILGTSGLGIATGIKLLIVSVTLLIAKGIAVLRGFSPESVPSGPFGDDDLGFIAVAGFILIFVSIREGIGPVFKK